jgi:hypothetical protein
MLVLQETRREGAQCELLGVFDVPTSKTAPHHVAPPPPAPPVVAPVEEVVSAVEVFHAGDAVLAQAAKAQTGRRSKTARLANKSLMQRFTHLFRTLPPSPTQDLLGDTVVRLDYCTGGRRSKLLKDPNMVLRNRCTTAGS